MCFDLRFKFSKVSMALVRKLIPGNIHLKCHIVSYLISLGSVGHFLNRIVALHVEVNPWYRNCNMFAVCDKHLAKWLKCVFLEQISAVIKVDNIDVAHPAFGNWGYWVCELEGRSMGHKSDGIAPDSCLLCQLLESLTHWGRDKMAAIFQTTFSKAFSWIKMYEFRLRFHWILFPMVQLTIFQHWFRSWLGPGQATSHDLNQWWLVYCCIYASLGLNELMQWNPMSPIITWPHNISQ